MKTLFFTVIALIQMACAWFGAFGLLAVVSNLWQWRATKAIDKHDTIKNLVMGVLCLSAFFLLDALFGLQLSPEDPFACAP